MGVPPWKYKPSLAPSRIINLEGTEHVIPRISENTTDFLGRVIKGYEDHKEKEKDDVLKQLLELKDSMRKIMEDLPGDVSDGQVIEDVLQGKASNAWDVKDYDPFLIERTSSMIASLEESYDWQSGSGEVMEQLISYLKSVSPEEQNQILEDIDRLEINDLESSILESENDEKKSEFLDQAVDGEGRVIGFHTVDVDNYNDVSEPEDGQYDNGDIPVE